MRKKFKKKFSKRLIKGLLSVVLIISWLLADWPPLLEFRIQNTEYRIPPKFQEVKAALSMSFVGSVEGSATNGGDVTLSLSGLGLQEGDLVMVAYAIGDNDNSDFNMAILSPTGYTEVADLFANDTQDANLGVYWKIMGATPDTSVQVDGLGGTDAAVSAVAMAFRGVDPTTPMDVTPTTTTGLNTMHPDPPSIDYVSTGVWIVIAGASGHALNLANTNNPYTFPTGYTVNPVQRPENDTSDISVGLGYRTNPADPEDPGVMTHSGTNSANYSWGAVTIALRPKVVTFNQSAYRFFSNVDSTDVGSPLAAQDTAATLSSAGQAFRLRMLLHIGTNTLLLNEQSFKLQFAQRGADNLCDTSFSGETYADVTAATVIAYNDNTTPADGAALTANANDPTHGADTIVNQTYEEANNFTNSVAAIPAGQDGKWDFSLIDNSAPSGTTYCFRAVKSDGTILDTYTVIPQITTATPTTTYTQNDFEWFVDAASVTLTDPWPSGGVDLAENEVFTQLPAPKKPLVSGDKIRIQINITVGGANLSANAQAFQLEYVAASDCTTATGWTAVGAIGSATIWRFFDNTSLTDGVTQVNQISTSTAGAEGRYLESNSASWTNPNAVNVGQSMEWDFAIENNGAAENTTYCFRVTKYGGTALDTYNSDSYPKLTTAPGISNLMRHGNFFQGETEKGFYWAN